MQLYTKRPDFSKQKCTLDSRLVHALLSRFRTQVRACTTMQGNTLKIVCLFACFLFCFLGEGLLQSFKKVPEFSAEARCAWYYVNLSLNFSEIKIRDFSVACSGFVTYFCPFWDSLFLEKWWIGSLNEIEITYLFKSIFIRFYFDNFRTKFHLDTLKNVYR